MIIWDYVKGLNADGNSYTFIKFPSTNINTTAGEYKTTPSIYTTGPDNDPYETKEGTVKLDFGKILTSYDYIELEKKNNSNLELILKKSSEIDATKPEYFRIINNYIRYNDAKTIPFQINLANDQIDLTGYLQTYKGMNVAWYDADAEKTLISTSISVVSSQDKISYGIKTNGMIYTEQNIKTEDKCEALYFNATSDERAKENFIYVSRTHALEWINNLNIYTFNYRDNGKSSIGITTQQIQYEPVNNFNFVDNIEATGENGDYMTIKESKLVYMCMSAIQELSQQNQILQHQISMLQDEINMLQNQR